MKNTALVTFGMLIGAVALYLSDRQPPMPVLSAIELERKFVLTEPARPIEVRFASPEEINRVSPGARAYASYHPDSGPCTITLPIGMPIRFGQEGARAMFVMTRDADTVAHELLHCLRGKWHK
jgi:hypothetical protein